MKNKQSKLPSNIDHKTRERQDRNVPGADRIDPVVDLWLQELARIAVAIAAREQRETEVTDARTDEP